MPYTAYIARIVRAAAIDALNQPYIRTARAKGLPTHTILLRHAARPTLMPLVSFLGPALAGVLTGSIVVEQVFGLPGIGRLFVTGALNRDYTVVTGDHGALRRADHRPQPAGRPVLRVARSARAGAH